VKALLFLEALKKQAQERFLVRMGEARKRPVPAVAEDAYMQGMRDGYAEGLADGVKLGIEVNLDSKNTYESPTGTA